MLLLSWQLVVSMTEKRVLMFFVYATNTNHKAVTRDKDTRTPENEHDIYTSNDKLAEQLAFSFTVI